MFLDKTNLRLCYELADEFKYVGKTFGNLIQLPDPFGKQILQVFLNDWNSTAIVKLVNLNWLFQTLITNKANPILSSALTNLIQYYNPSTKTWEPKSVEWAIGKLGRDFFRTEETQDISYYENVGYNFIVQALKQYAKPNPFKISFDNIKNNNVYEAFNTPIMPTDSNIPTPPQQEDEVPDWIKSIDKAEAEINK